MSNLIANRTVRPAYPLVFPPGLREPLPKEHYTEHKADSAEIKAGITQISDLLGQLIERDERPEGSAS